MENANDEDFRSVVCFQVTRGVLANWGKKILALIYNHVKMLLP